MKYDDFSVVKVTYWGKLRVVELDEDDHRLPRWLNEIMVTSLYFMVVYSVGFYVFHVVKFIVGLF